MNIPKKLSKNTRRIMILSLFAFFFLFISFENNSIKQVNNQNNDIDNNNINDNIPIFAGTERNLTLTLFDIDSNPISGAFVSIYDENTFTTYSVFSDLDGNATFVDIVNASYQLTVNFSIGDKNLNYTIKNSIFEFDIEEGNSLSAVIFCDLVTIDLTVRDFMITDPLYWGLNNANITIQNQTTGENLTSFYSNPQGLVQMRLPTAVFDVIVQYQGKQREFFFNILGNLPIFAFTQELDTTSSGNYNMDISISEKNTALKIINLEYQEPLWDHTSEIENFPYSLNLYYEDIVNMTIQWNNTLDEIGVLPPTQGTWNTWTITRNDNQNVMNSSTNFPDGLVPINGEKGNYTFVFDTSDYYAGSYTFYLKCNRTGYQDAILSLTINILNFTTSFSQLPTTETVYIGWNTTLNLELNYTSSVPEKRNISDAIFSYSISSKDFSGFLSVPEDNSGIYSLSRLIEIPVGTYQLKIAGNQTNYQFQQKSIVIVVEPIETELNIEIQEDLKISSNYFKVAHGENITFTINYTNDETGDSLENANTIVYVDNIEPIEQYLYQISPGFWNITFPSDTYSSNTMHSIRIESIKDNYETQSTTITADILDYWDTEIGVVEAPLNYIWGDNATFVIKYYCSESPSPRENIPLEEAQITEFNLSTKIGSNYFTQASLNNSNIGIAWGWEDLSKIGGTDGEYRIWFNTTILNITSLTKFYCIPKMNIGVYREAIKRDIYFDLSLLQSNIDAVTEENPSSEITLLKLDKGLEESINILTKLTVDQEESIRDDLGINNALIFFEIRNSSDDSHISYGSFENFANGIYNCWFESSSLAYGDYIVYINSTAQNHTYAQTSFALSIIGDLDFEITIPEYLKISATSLKAALDENFTFYVNITDSVPEGISIKVYIDENPVEIDWIYYVGDNSYLCTKESSTFSTGTHNIRIFGQRTEFITQEINIELEIIESWGTATEIITPPDDLSWGCNETFVIRYYVEEQPRTNLDISDATISYLIIGNETGSGAFYVLLTAEHLGTLWNWENLAADPEFGPGNYRIWFNTSVFPMYYEQIIYAVPSISSLTYESLDVYIPILLSPTDTILTLEDPNAGQNFNLITLTTGDNTTISAHYFISDEFSPFDGNNLNSAVLSYQITNKSDGTVFPVNYFDFTGDGIYNLNINSSDLSPHEFNVIVFAYYGNHTSQSFEFTLIIGQEETTFSYSIDPLLKVSHTSLKVVHGENLTLTVTIDNLNDLAAWVEIYLDNYQIPIEYIYRLENGDYLCSAPIDDLPYGTYELRIVANKVGFLPGELSFEAIIKEAWNTKLNVVEPPIMYPWGNFVSFNVSYLCDEYPRNGTMLTGAIFSSLEIVLIDDENQMQMLYLTQTDLGTSWGYLELLNSKGSGFYNIWFNTSLLNITETTSYYIIPTVSKPLYNQTTAKPYFILNEVPTNVILAVNSTSFIDIELIEVYLDDPANLTTHYLVTDLTSIFFDFDLNDAIVEYTIYNKSNNDAIWIQGTLINIGNGSFYLDLPTYIIGNYTVEIVARKQNFVTSTGEINFVVMKKVINYKYEFNNENGATTTPQNNEIEIVISAVDEKGNTLTNGTLIAELSGNTYTFVEDSNNPGIYRSMIQVDDLKGLSVGEVYSIDFIFSKTNYTDQTFTVQLKIDLPVDPVLGVPYAYWAVMMITIGAFVTLVGVRYALKKARIPTIIKRITIAEKIITKGKVAPDKHMALTAVQEMYKIYANDWKMLKLNLASALDLKDLENQDEELKDLMNENLIKFSDEEDILDKLYQDDIAEDEENSDDFTTDKDKKKDKIHLPENIDADEFLGNEKDSSLPENDDQKENLPDPQTVKILNNEQESLSAEMIDKDLKQEGSTEITREESTEITPEETVEITSEESAENAPEESNEDSS